MATISDVLSAVAYYVGNGGYYEKADGTEKYLTRDVANFAANKGSANYTYFGKICGINPGAWCAMLISTAVLEACGTKAAAKKALWGIWPYAACNQLFDAGLANNASHYSWYQRNYKGKTGAAYTPQVGDVIVFTSNGTTRSHTGIVYAVDTSNVYTYEGNTSDKAAKRSYSLKSASIYGYVTLNLSAGDESGIKKFQTWLGVTADGAYGPETSAAAVKRLQAFLNTTYSAGISQDGEWGSETYYAMQSVQQGDENEAVFILQGLLYCLGYDPVGFDGSFGKNTLTAVAKYQSEAGLSATGIADAYTWAKMFGFTRPTHTILKKGSAGAEVKYLQRLLGNHGQIVATDGVFGTKTEKAVKAFQAANGLEQDGVVGADTWGKIE